MDSAEFDDLVLPASLQLRVGEAWETRLPGLGSAGYGWRVEIDDPPVVESDLTPLEPDVWVPPGGPPPDAYSVDHVLTLRAVRPGHTTVRLRLEQPWDPDQPPRWAYDISIGVSAA